MNDLRRPTAVLALLLAALAMPAMGEGRAAGAGAYAHTASWSPRGQVQALLRPIDVVLADDGRLYVADGRTGQVLVFREGEARPVQAWAAGPGVAQDGAFAYPLAVEIDRARGRVGLLWRAGDALHFELRGLDGAILAGPWPAPAADVPDLAFDPDTGGLLLPAPADCRVYLVHPNDGTIAARFSLAALGCEAAHIAGLPSGMAAIQTGHGAHHVDGATGERLGGYGLDGYRPVDVAADAQGRVHVLVRAPPTRRPPSDALTLVFGPDRALVRTLDAPAAGLARLPFDSAWPWALDVAASSLAVLGAGDQLYASVRGLDGAGGWQVLGEDTQPAFTPGASPAAGGAMSLAMAPDGRLVALDEGLPRLIAYGPDGDPAAWARRPEGTRELAVAADGAAYVTDGAGEAMRLNAAGGVAWRRPCACAYGGGQIAAAGDRVFVGLARQQAVAVLEAATGLEVSQIRRPAAAPIGWWPADLALAAGHLVTADMARGRLAAWSAAGEALAGWLAGIFDGPYRLAGGRAADGTPVVAALLTDGHVELYDAASGRLLDRWEPRLEGGAAFQVADLAMGEDGRIYLADAGSRQVHVFEPGGAPAPSPSPAPTPSDAACRVRGDKVARPDRVRLGEASTITLTLRTDCPPAAPSAGADIVLLMDVSSSMDAEAYAAARAAAVTFVLNTDAAFHRVGAVAFSDRAWPVHPLTRDLAKVVEGLEALTVVTKDGPTDVAPALDQAQSWLRDGLRPGAQPVVVLLTDGQFQGALDPRPMAEAMRRAGTILYAIGLGRADEDTLLAIAGRADRAFLAAGPEDLAPIYRQVRRLVEAGAAGQVLVDDIMGAEMALAPGSANPPAVEGPDRLRWGFTALPREGVTLTYRVVPRRIGRWPANLAASADYVDGDGVPRRFVFPVPQIEVLGDGPAPTEPGPVSPTPAPTSSPPSQTSTPPPTRGPTATLRPTPAPRPIYLPSVRREPTCPARRKPIEVALVLDASSSMLAPAAGGETKLAAAVRAAETFLGQLDPAADRAAVVAFNRDAKVLQGLTGDPQRVRAAMRRIATATETRLDLGVEAAHGELVASSRWGSASSVMIVLTDGRANPVPADVAVTRALRARRDRITVFTIGLGDDLDLDALLRMSSRPGYFYRAADAGDLVEIYRAIAVQLPCAQ